MKNALPSILGGFTFPGVVESPSCVSNFFGHGNSFFLFWGNPHFRGTNQGILCVGIKFIGPLHSYGKRRYRCQN